MKQLPSLKTLLWVEEDYNGKRRHRPAAIEDLSAILRALPAEEVREVLRRDVRFSVREEQEAKTRVSYPVLADANEYREQIPTIARQVSEKIVAGTDAKKVIEEALLGAYLAGVLANGMVERGRG